MTTEQLLSEWLNDYERDRIKAQTYIRYKGLIDLHIVPAMGECAIEDLTRRQIHDFLTEEKKTGNRRGEGGLSPTSINLMLTVLNMAFEYAVTLELVELNPCDRVKRTPGARNKTAEAFTKEEQKRLEKTIENEGDTKLFGIVLCLYTGLRIGELLALEWSDLNDDLTMLTVNKTVYREQTETGEYRVSVDSPKTSSANRYIPLPKHITRQLKRLRQKSNSPYIVPNRYGGRMSVRSYQYIFERLTEKAEIRKLNFHALRHTFATRALEKGIDIKTLSELLGHKNATITMNRYAHSMMDTKIAMMGKMTKIV